MMSWSLNVIYFLQILWGDGSKITSDICWSHSAVFLIFGCLEIFGYSQGYINESRDSSTLYETWKNRTKIALEVDCKFNEFLIQFYLILF